MTTENKYPNADTSSERLAEITETWAEHQKKPSHVWEFDGADITRDLLAMLQERAVWAKDYEDGIKDLRQELHELRWRKLSEEAPPKSVNLWDVDDYPDSAKFIISREDDNGVEWWRPIPPLPKE